MVKEKTRPPPCFIFVILRNLHLYSRMLQLSLFIPQIQISLHHRVIVSSPVISHSVWFRNHSVAGTAALPATMATRQTGELVYIGCIVQE